jgi:TPP-dependent indolepyruvate ferredoxin oxidoreductase alpha subunit
MKIYGLLFIAIMAAALFATAPLALPTALADSVSVVNNISTSATTGGNSVGSSTSVRQGTARTSVEIDQTVNGIAQPPVIVTTSSPGSVNVNVTTKVSQKNGSVTSTTAIIFKVQSFFATVFKWISLHMK